MPQGGARGQNSGHHKTFLFSFIESVGFLTSEVLFRAVFLCVTLDFWVIQNGARGHNLGHLQSVIQIF